MKILRRAYDWVLSWADKRWSLPALFCLSFFESFIFPIPPDPLLMALALGKRSKALFYAAVSTVGSVCGGVCGYLLGYKLMQVVGIKIINFYHAQQMYQRVAELYQRYDFWAVFIAGFTPIPYKVFTIAAGACSLSLSAMILASILSRGLRFFIVAALIQYFGEPIRKFIDRYFNLLSILFVILLVIGFFLLGRL